jgi:hypothetical protein
MPSKSQQTAEAAASNEELPGVAQQQPPEIPPDSPPAPPAGDGAKDKAKSGKCLNLTRFLQEKPQGSGVRVLLNAKYRTAVKTMDEWETALKDLLGKKTK